MSKFQVLEFNPNTMVKNLSILIIGKRGTGKSILINHLLQFIQNREETNLTIVSPTERLNPYLRNKFTNAKIEYDLTDTFMEQYVKTASDMKINKSNKSTTLVLDQCLAQKKCWARDPNIMEIVMNGRCYRINCIMVVQTPIGIPPEMRLNFDYVFIFGDDSHINKKKIWDNYVSMLPNYNVFERVFDVCTQDYKCMVINNIAHSENIQEKIFWFRATIDNLLDDSETTTSCEDCDSMSETDLHNNTSDITIDVMNIINSEKQVDLHDWCISEKLIPNNVSNNVFNNVSNNVSKNVSKNIALSPNNNLLKLHYYDDNCEILLQTSDLADHLAIKLVCDQISFLKQLKENNKKPEFTKPSQINLIDI